MKRVPLVQLQVFSSICRQSNALQAEYPLIAGAIQAR